MASDEEWLPNVVGVPIPNGFRLYVRSKSWGRRVGPDVITRAGDAIRDRLSLFATGDDMSGLAQVPTDRLWRLDVRSRRVSDDDFGLIARFDQLEDLDLTGTDITDRSALELHTLQHLRVLKLGDCAITDAAMDHISALRRLEHLELWRTGVTDEGLRGLAFHPNLRVLHLRDTPVSGERLDPLLTLPKLRQLCLSGKQRRRARRFIAERPDVEILY